MLTKNKLIQLLVNTLPTVAIKAVPLVPAPLSQFTLERLFNSFFKHELAAGSLDFMRNNWVHIGVRDLGFDFYISVQQHRHQPYLRVRHHHANPDVALSGDMDDLFLLMTQYVDPDTLFFRRKLTLRGDTELGLELKNFLDTIELHSHLPHRLHQWSLALALAVSERQISAH